MTHNRHYFFCGIGGSGMLPLALILKAKGAVVSGSDRALDQGRTGDKFDFLRARGIRLFAQDGSGVTDPKATVVISAAVEESVPDVRVAKAIGSPLMTRAQLLAELFNAAPLSIGVAGTSGKSTTTGMIGWILRETGRDPTIMNGAVMKNFVTADAPFASALVGAGDTFVSEVDESDGSIALYSPKIAVVNNISLDHKSMEELRALFRDFTAKARTAVLNLDNAESTALAKGRRANQLRTYSLSDHEAQLFVSNVMPAQDGISFEVHEGKASAKVELRMPGRHNISNALAAISAARAAGVELTDAAAALASFAGIRRRLEFVGTAKGVTVLDDFAHNPDKIEATLSTLHDFPGRLLVMFQPHGYGPLKLMKAAFIESFALNLWPKDVLIMPDPVYFGGTADKSVTSKDIVDRVRAMKRTAFAIPDRAACGDKLIELAQPGDRIVVMGARDDTLSTFARELVGRLGGA